MSNWPSIRRRFKAGDEIAVEITGTTPFGAFVSILDCPDCRGLIRISELPQGLPVVGSRGRAAVIGFDDRNQQILFSLWKPDLG